MLAKLTASQLATKQVIWDYFTSPETSQLPVEQRRWLEGYKLVLSADSVLVYSSGHTGGFQINFSLSVATARELCYQAALRKPDDPASADALVAYKQRRAAARKVQGGSGNVAQGERDELRSPSDQEGSEHSEAGAGPSGGSGDGANVGGLRAALGKIVVG